MMNTDPALLGTLEGYGLWKRVSEAMEGYYSAKLKRMSERISAGKKLTEEIEIKTRIK